jgi:hypothetical protein
VPQGLVGNMLLQHLDSPIVAEHFPGIYSRSPSWPALRRRYDS